MVIGDCLLCGAGVAGGLRKAGATGVAEAPFGGVVGVALSILLQRS